jgi:hypothetical protein
MVGNKIIFKKIFLSGLAAFLFFPSFSQEKKDRKDSSNASYYGENFHGQETSNGEFFDQDDFTAAHRTFPFNTILHVVNKQNGKSVIVRVNDRGPFVKSRVIDLSRSAAKKIGMVPMGVVPVYIREMKLLDYVHLGDSLFNENEVWDCFGALNKMTTDNIFVWGSSNWKHAFYMASQICLDYKLQRVTIFVSGNLSHRHYLVLIPGLDSKKEREHIITRLREDGFPGAKMYMSH